MGREWCGTLCRVTCALLYFHIPWVVGRKWCGTLCRGPCALLYCHVPWVVGREFCGTLCKVYALTHLYDNISSSIDNKQFTVDIFIDLSKAFTEYSRS